MPRVCSRAVEQIATGQVWTKLWARSMLMVMRTETWLSKEHDVPAMLPDSWSEKAEGLHLCTIKRRSGMTI